MNDGSSSTSAPPPPPTGGGGTGAVTGSPVFVDWVTLIIIVVVVCVATFVCTIAGKFFMDWLKRRQKCRVDQCHQCNANNRHYPGHVGLEMEQRFGDSFQGFYDRRRRGTSLYGRGSQERRDGFAHFRQSQSGGKRGRGTETGTFGRLGIGRSGSGNNLLLPLARQLEDQMLSPIQQTPPNDHDNIELQRLGGDAVRLLQENSASFRSKNNSLSSTSSGKRQRKSPAMVNNPSFNPIVTPSPAKTSINRRRPEFNLEEDFYEDGEVFYEDLGSISARAAAMPMSTGLSSKVKILSMGDQQQQVVFTPENALLKRGDGSKGNLDYFFQEPPTLPHGGQGINLQTFADLAAAAATARGDASGNDVDGANYVHDSAVERATLLTPTQSESRQKSQSKLGGPGSTIPTPLGARPKLQQKRYVEDVATSEGEVTDASGQESPLPLHHRHHQNQEDALCPTCGGSNRSLNQKQAEPERTFSVGSVRQVKKVDRERKRRKMSEQDVVAGVVVARSTSASHVDLLGSPEVRAEADSMFRKNPVGSVSSEERRLSHHFDGKAHVSPSNLERQSSPDSWEGTGSEGTSKPPLSF